MSYSIQYSKLFTENKVILDDYFLTVFWSSIIWANSQPIQFKRWHQIEVVQIAAGSSPLPATKSDLTFHPNNRVCQKHNKY